ncbi:MAG: asparagine synthase (glutamine-hydrolyzing) [Proteobacteria bacterium]|nr:asparagine synthase (glutamine-hydrolyzing) [Pseudomonadota bacterium]
MCGIAGWAGDIGIDEAALGRMCAAVAHRGPDAEGRHVVPGTVGLGFRRLAIIDLETGDQPIADERGDTLVTCNGEIYNFAPLREELRGRGHIFATGSDCEAIVHLYEERGPEFLEALQGMFAIALWDARAERLLLARDRLGVKPLYWAQVDEGILYGSEPAAILASGLVDPRPDPVALREYLTLQYVPPPRSGFAGIHKLAPGERLLWQGGEVKVEPWWRLDWSHRRPEGTEEALAELDRLLAQATRERLVADVPVGAFLSGGIDSSLVVSYMAEAGSRVRTFSVDFPETGFSEGPHARRVAAIYGTEHEERTLEPAMVPLVEEAVRFAGEPFADSSAIPTLLLSRMTRESVTVALSGDGGDEAFAGYRRYLVARTAERLGPITALARAVPDGAAIQRLPGAGRQVRRLVDALALPPAERYASMMSHFAPPEVASLCTPDFLAAAGDPASAWSETLAPPALPGVDRYLALDTATYLPGDLLLKVDRMSMADALEVRSPLLDYRVHEFAARLPGRMKLRGKTTKWALKELAGRRGLPRDLVHRRKQGFGVPLATWFRGPLRGWLESLLLDPASLERGYFRPDAVRELVDQHLGGGLDHSTRLWNLAVLELWHRTWVDG